MSGGSYPAASIRLVWDEPLSPGVPRALRELGFKTSHVGSSLDGAPPKGSTDRAVLDHAQGPNQIIVTSNHDMMMLCAEASERFIWVDPRGRQLTRAEQVLLVFGQIERWQELLTSFPTHSVRSMRTRCDEITPDEAARLASRRMRELRRRNRQRSTAAGPIGPLLGEDFS